ncbi:MAG: bifunctional folylpolyglutamate synthase/dihydrofolate synthase [Planctomycetales bacterium]|nr:bifunctional folylpolyglutamate synthase/dihydrofolate synthase [Planctomycetales bacterium]
MSNLSPIHDYAAALEFLLGRIDYERAPTIPYQERHLKLDRMRDLLERLGNPHFGMPVVHIAGSKGKGSTATFVSSITSANGYRTGLYTSPHFQVVQERLRIDGLPCSEEEFVELTQYAVPAIKAMDACDDAPTFFEIITALAFVHFRRQQVDLAVLEVGLGGRLDSTNVCEPLVTIITSISFDHTRQLGNTLRSIAYEKAGIIKPNISVISGVRQGEARDEIERVARERGAPVITLGEDMEVVYHWRANGSGGESPTEAGPAGTMASSATNVASLTYVRRDHPGERLDWPLSMPGEHQAANAALALAAVDVLAEQGWQFCEESTREGLGSSRCPGRIEIVSRDPLVILDTAHNPASIRALLDVIRTSCHPARRVIVFGTTRGKDSAAMLAILATECDHLILTQYRNNPRSHPPDDLAMIVGELESQQMTRCTYEVIQSCESAWERARAMASDQDLICVTGSFFLAAELEGLVRG